jgi:hypothetical protein
MDIFGQFLRRMGRYLVGCFDFIWHLPNFGNTAFIQSPNRPYCHYENANPVGFFLFRKSHAPWITPAQYRIAEFMGEKPKKTTSLRPLSSKTSFFIRKPTALSQSPKESKQPIDISNDSSQEFEGNSPENPLKKIKGDEELQDKIESTRKENLDKFQNDQIDLISSDSNNDTIGDKDLKEESKGKIHGDEDEEFFKNLSPEVQALYRQTQAARAKKTPEDESIKVTFKIRFKVENRTKSEQHSESAIPLEILNDEPFKNLINQAARFVGVAPALLELCSVEGGRIPPSLTPEQCRLVEGNIILHLLDRKGFEQRTQRISKEQKERIEKSKSEEPQALEQKNDHLTEPLETAIILSIRERGGTITQIKVDPDVPLVGQIFEKFGGAIKEGRVIFDGQRLAPSATASALGLENDDMLDFIPS